SVTERYAGSTVGSRPSSPGTLPATYAPPASESDSPARAVLGVGAGGLADADATGMGAALGLGLGLGLGCSRQDESDRRRRHARKRTPPRVTPRDRAQAPCATRRRRGTRATWTAPSRTSAPPSPRAAPSPARSRGSSATRPCGDRPRPRR